MRIKPDVCLSSGRRLSLERYKICQNFWVNLEDLIIGFDEKVAIHIDHLDELYTLIQMSHELNQRPKVAIPINLRTGVQPMWDRFGFNYENGQPWDAINKLADGWRVATHLIRDQEGLDYLVARERVPVHLDRTSGNQENEK